jgi:uncharacterized protein YrrD
MDVKKLKGIAVVSVRDGEKLGQVDDVIIDAQERRLGAVRIGSGSLLRKDHQFVPFEAVRSIGDDAVMVEDQTVLQKTYGERAAGYHSLGTIGGLRVVTDGGSYIGNVTTAHFDPASGALTDFEVGHSGLSAVFSSNRVVAADSVTSIGIDIMIIPAALIDGRPEATTSHS